MIDYLNKKLAQLNIDEYKFFRLAHIWRFGKDPDMCLTVYKYRRTGVIPSFVIEYLEQMQKKEHY